MASEEAIQYRQRYEHARKKAEAIVDSYIKEYKSNGFTLKEMELLSEVFSERIRTEVERAKYFSTV